MHSAGQTWLLSKLWRQIFALVADKMKRWKFTIDEAFKGWSLVGWRENQSSGTLYKRVKAAVSAHPFPQKILSTQRRETESAMLVRKHIQKKIYVHILLFFCLFV